VEIFSITQASITSLATEYGCGEELQVGDSRFAPYLFQMVSFSSLLHQMEFGVSSLVKYFTVS